MTDSELSAPAPRQRLRWARGSAAHIVLRPRRGDAVLLGFVQSDIACLPYSELSWVLGSSWVSTPGTCGEITVYLGRSIRVVLLRSSR